MKPPKLEHDGTLTIATGSSRFDKHWRSRETLWSELLSRLAEPQRTQESLAEYLALPAGQQAQLKDVGGFVGGALKGGRRTAASIAWRQVVTLDADFATSGLFFDLDLARYAWALYSTRKHQDAKPRLRILIPLSRPVAPDEYQALARRIAADLGIEQFDDTTYEPHRLMYWPSCSRDAEYLFDHSDAPWLDVDATLARYEDWRDSTQWPVADRFRAQMRQRAKKAGDPLTKPGVIGAFCRAYSIEAVITEFLSALYTPGPGEGRYTYTDGTGAGGLVLYEDRFAYSHHGTDPISGRLCNAFDLVRIHLHGDQDEEAAEDTPVNRLPSTLAMLDWARELGPVRRELAARDFESEEGEETPDDAWREALAYNRRGGLEPTIENYRLILTHDPALAGKLRFSEFAHQPEAVGELPWRAPRANGEWLDADDASLVHWLEVTYRTAPKALNVMRALLVVWQANTYHPVRDYLESLEWDGEPRAERLLVRYFGAEDSAYVRGVTRTFLAGAVTRILRPGCKFDYMLTLVGAQGAGKSEFVNVLGKGWSTDSFSTVTGKEAYEQLHGVWLVEVAELTATRRSDVESVKHFLTKRKDRYRVAYGRRAQTFYRHCVFIGSTNDRTALVDQTGNRRFWMVDVRPTRPPTAWLPELEAERDQVWAEVMTWVRDGEALYLPPELDAEAREVQETHRMDDGLAGRIAAWLEHPVPFDWYDRTLEERLAHLRSDFPFDGATALRDRVCAREVWVECLRGAEDRLTQAKAREINDALRQLGWEERASARLGCYGRTRGFVRAGGARDRPD